MTTFTRVEFHSSRRNSLTHFVTSWRREIRQTLRHRTWTLTLNWLMRDRLSLLVSSTAFAVSVSQLVMLIVSYFVREHHSCTKSNCVVSVKNVNSKHTVNTDYFLDCSGRMVSCYCNAISITTTLRNQRKPRLRNYKKW